MLEIYIPFVLSFFVLLSNFELINKRHYIHYLYHQIFQQSHFYLLTLTTYSIYPYFDTMSPNMYVNM